MTSHSLLHRIKRKWACLAVCLLLSACQGNTVYHSYRPVATAGWGKGDTLVYALPRTILPGTYEMEIGIRHQETYPYRDVWIEISQNMQDTLVYAADTLHLFLADETGNWNGSGNGGLYQFAQPGPSLLIRQEGTHRSIRVVHIMKDKPLKGISDIGIRLRKTAP